jgi:uncharacterized lipoprotein YddW (UPF0748 family)
MKKHFLSIAACCLLATVTAFSQPKYEFRAAWVATVDNIDWPTRGNYDTEKQKAEFIALLDMHKRNGLNALVVQIRPAADAFYPSPYEPWSQWLTGKQGKPPSPYYDPLQFMIEETHKRGMEFHAWCNPYRAEFSIGRSSIAANHSTKTHPEWFVSYGGTRYFDPGNKEAQQFVVKVIRDVVSRYAVDAIHFDDYFYPYKVPGKEFPDNKSFAKYGNGMTRDDWRRSNVDSIIVMLSRAIKETNRYCRFGISPFGVWRNKSDDPEGSDTQAGPTNYGQLYADILLWLKNGWIDYVAPQLYWEFSHRVAPYGVLVDWWAKHSYGRHCYIGLAPYRANSNEAWRDKTQLPRQLAALRTYPEIQGAIYFSSASFINNPNGWSDSLRYNYYKEPALIPGMPWIDSLRPTAPTVKSFTVVDSSTFDIMVMRSELEKRPLKSFNVYLSTDTTAAFINFYSAKQIHSETGGDSCVFRVQLPANKRYAGVYLTVTDTNGNESLPYPGWPVPLHFEKLENEAWIVR